MCGGWTPSDFPNCSCNVTKQYSLCLVTVIVTSQLIIVTLIYIGMLHCFRPACVVLLFIYNVAMIFPLSVISVLRGVGGGGGGGLVKVVNRSITPHSFILEITIS